MGNDDIDTDDTDSTLSDALGFNLGPKDLDTNVDPAPLPDPSKHILDEGKKKITKTEPSKKIQRSFWVEEETWAAAADLPVSRTQIMSKALLEAVTSYKSELPQLLAEIKELDHVIECLQIQRSAKQQRVKELQEAQEQDKEAVNTQTINRQQAATELIRLLDEHGKNMMPLQFKRLEELSGIKIKNIKTFLEKTHYFPSNEQVKEFFGA